MQTALVQKGTHVSLRTVYRTMSEVRLYPLVAQTTRYHKG
ncbi:MAG: hypothetical protein K6G82_04180 [Ruminococcus sp.]|nr:hypothetical protein [Ruminococcus sp.]